MSGQDFNRVTGEFTLSQFVPDSPNVLTLTSEGNILVWTAPSTQGPQLKRVLKLYQHSEGVPLTCIQSQYGYLVLGNARGEVSFLDRDLKLTQWKERVATGPINSISFAVSVSERKLHKHLIPKETTIQQSKFSVPDFMAGMCYPVLLYLLSDNSILGSISVATVCDIVSHDLMMMCYDYFYVITLFHKYSRNRFFLLFLCSSM